MTHQDFDFGFDKESLLFDVFDNDIHKIKEIVFFFSAFQHFIPAQKTKNIFFTIKPKK